MPSTYRRLFSRLFAASWLPNSLRRWATLSPCTACKKIHAITWGISIPSLWLPLLPRNQPLTKYALTELPYNLVSSELVLISHKPQASRIIKKSNCCKFRPYKLHRWCFLWLQNTKFGDRSIPGIFHIDPDRVPQERMFWSHHLWLLALPSGFLSLCLWVVAHSNLTTVHKTRGLEKP